MKSQHCWSAALSHSRAYLPYAQILHTVARRAAGQCIGTRVHQLACRSSWCQTPLSHRICTLHAVRRLRAAVEQLCACWRCWVEITRRELPRRRVVHSHDDILQVVVMQSGQCRRHSLVQRRIYGTVRHKPPRGRCRKLRRQGSIFWGNSGVRGPEPRTLCVIRLSAGSSRQCAKHGIDRGHGAVGLQQRAINTCQPLHECAVSHVNPVAQADYARGENGADGVKLGIAAIKWRIRVVALPGVVRGRGKMAVTQEWGEVERECIVSACVTLQSDHYSTSERHRKKEKERERETLCVCKRERERERERETKKEKEREKAKKSDQELKSTVPKRPPSSLCSDRYSFSSSLL